MRKIETYTCSKQIESLDLMSFMISHKLRGPLCSILAAVPLLNDTTIRVIDKNAYIDLVCQSAFKLELFTRELSCFIDSTRASLMADGSKILKAKRSLLRM